MAGPLGACLRVEAEVEGVTRLVIRAELPAGLRVGWVEDERETTHEADQPASDAPDGYEGDRTLQDLWGGEGAVVSTCMQPLWGTKAIGRCRTWSFCIAAR